MSSAIAFALSRGIRLQEIKALTGLTGLDLANPDVRIPDDILPTIWRELGARFPDKVLSLEMAGAAPFSTLGGLSDGAQYAATLRDALGLFIENDRFVADRLELTLELTEAEASFVIRHPLQATDLGRTNEGALGFMHRLIVEHLEIPGYLERVELGHPAYGPPSFHETFFQAPVLFECDRYALVIKRPWLDEPASRSNGELFSFIQCYLTHARESVARETVPAELRRLMDAVIENAANGVFSTQETALRAGLSLRQAQRTASANGRTLIGMIHEVRMEMAKELLQEPRAGMAKIAALLGYSDDRAFRRAFKRWAGVSPSVFRLSHNRR